MTRFIEGEERSQSVLFPERLEDWIAEDNPVRVVDVFIDELDLKRLGFEGAMAAETEECHGKEQDATYPPRRDSAR